LTHLRIGRTLLAVIRKDWKKRRKLTRDEYAKKCGVSKMAISKAVKRGEVVEDDGGIIDTTNPVNRAYLQADHAVMKRAKAAGAGARGDKSKRRGELWERKTLSEIRLKDEQTNYHVQRRARELGLLIERAMVDRAIAAIGAEIKLRILGLPRQVAQELFDLAHSKGATPMALEGLLLERLSDALVHVKEKGREAGLGSIGS
jgi:phage terminase Nu1 subunit (DNA packaging protein)